MLRAACLLSAFSLLAVAGRSDATPEIAFSSYQVPTSGVVVVPVRAGDAPGDSFEQVDAAAGGALRRAMAATGFKGGENERLSLAGIAPYDQVLLVGVADGTLTPRQLQDFGGHAVQGLKGDAATPADLLWSGAEPEAAEHIALGAQLGGYRFDRYRTGATATAATRTLVARTPLGDAAAQAYAAEWKPLASAVAFARDLVTEPGNVVSPEVFVERTRAAFRGVPGVRIEVLDVPAMEKLGMGSLLAVGQGSVRPPRLLVVRYDGAAAGEAPIAFVGKGITFDSGGLSIKPSDGMWRMKYDMTGAAVSTGTVLALAQRRAPVNAVAVAALAENMPSGSAARPGDVVRTMSGRTYEIISADAEGRMVLVDALWYVQQTHRPRAIVDVATLTGAIVTALGDEYAGLFANDETLATRLVQAGAASGEELWRMPIHPSYAKDLESPIADLRNGGGRPGAGTAAYFLSQWIQDGTPWAHLDIAGMAWRESAGTATSPSGATAFGVRLLDRLVRDHYE